MRTPRFEDENGGLAFERPAQRIDLPANPVEERVSALTADAGKVDRRGTAAAAVPADVARADEGSPAERTLSNPTRDPLDAYFRQISTGDLITREEEIALAKRIEDAQFALVDRLCRVPCVVQRVGAWGEDLREGRMRLGALLEGAPHEPGGETTEATESTGESDEERREASVPAGDLRLVGEAASRLDHIAALGVEISGIARKRVATLTRGKTPSRKTEERLESLLATAAREIADLNLHQDRIGELLDDLRLEARNLRSIERELLDLGASCALSQAEVIDRFSGRELDPELMAELRSGREPSWRALARSEDGRLGKIMSDFKVLAERLTTPPADFRQTIAAVGKARRNLKRMREEMVRSHLRLVVAVAKKYRGYSSLDLPDLIQEGNLGLMRAVEKYNYRHGVRVATYATWWIRQSITRAMADQGRMIRIPVHMGQTARKVQRERSKLRQQKGREPDAAEIAERSGVATTQVEQVMSLVSEPTSLDIPIGEDGDTTLADLIEAPDAVDPHQAAELASLRVCIAEALSELTPREERILRMRFGIGMTDHTLEQIGQVFGVTRERIRQIEAKALQKLREQGHSLDSFAET